MHFKHLSEEKKQQISDLLSLLEKEDSDKW